MLKSFITHKRGETDKNIADSIAFDAFRGRYAISDGVSRSFIPHIWSKTLVDYYIESDEKLSLTEDLLCRYTKAKELFLQGLDEFNLFLTKKVENQLHTSAATFAGVIIKNNVVTWQVIGDSCVFLVNDSKIIRCISSMPIDMDEEGHIWAKFDNYPNYVISDGTIKGHFVEGEEQLDSGWVVLMTDALSDWFIKQHNQGFDPFNTLIALNNNSEFEAFVENEYNAGRLKSDDTSVIIIDTTDYSQKQNNELNALADSNNYFEEDFAWELLSLWMG